MLFVLLFHEPSLISNKMTNEIDDIQAFIKQKNISCYGSMVSLLPDLIFQKDQGRVQIFSSEKTSDFISNKNIHIKQNWSVSDIRKQNANVCFLDKKAVKVLFAKFPSRTQYILVRFVPRISWFIAFPGLLRQLYVRRVSIGKILKLKTGKSFTRWLILKNNRVKSIYEHLLSSEIGIQGLLDYLRKEKVKYVVLRNYDALPNLSRADGDLDILVADEDEQKVKSFFLKYPGTIKVDIRFVSRKLSDTAYYTPHLKRKILETAIDGPTGSRIPAPKEAFLALAYHVVYDKGLSAGVPSRLPHLVANKFPDNDYAGTLAKLAKKLGLEVEITMEDLDEHLHREGWRPKTDTLANKMPENVWIQKRFFSDVDMQKPEIGLGVFILKEKALQANVADAILQEITRGGKFVILRTKKIAGEEQRLIADQLRSGFWTDGLLNLHEVNNFLPAMAVVILNLRLLHCSKANIKNIMPDDKIKDLKSKIRMKFDKEKTSLVHSTDTTSEGWEYVDVCFPDQASEIEKEINAVRDNLKLSLLGITKLHLTHVLYRRKRYKGALRRYVVDWIMS